jgi:alpha-tubulin suppressor-like RCC1 family protein
LYQIDRACSIIILVFSLIIISVFLNTPKVMADTSTPPTVFNCLVYPSSVELRLFQQLDPSTVNSSNFKLFDGGGALIPTSVSISSTDQYETDVTMKPIVKLNLGVTYTVSIANVKGTNGLTMTPYVTTFPLTPFRPNPPFNYLKAGAENSYFITDGEVLVWGAGEKGQIGDNAGLSHYMPASPTLQANDLAAGKDFDLTVTSGNIWAGGDNSKGQLGDGTTSSHLHAIQVPGMSNMVAVAVGDHHSLALKDDGTVWACGDNGKGQLGIGSNIDQNKFVQITGLSDIIAIAAGGDHSLALKNNGTILAWGDNSNGQLGNGNTDAQNSPVQVEGLNNVASLSAGKAHSLALKYDGTVFAWGLNEDGELGNGFDQYESTPVQVQGLSSVKSISAGYYFNMALKTDNTAWVWGDNHLSELGTATKALGAYTPIQISNWTDVTSIAAGGFHALVLRGSNNDIWGWGLNNEGQVGNGTLEHITTPVKVERDPVSFRLSGQTRTQTAIAIADEGWNYDSDTVVLVRDDDFPDALAGTPLAYGLNAPILLTNSKILSPETKVEIADLRAKNVIILGGTAVVSSNIEAQLKQNYSVTRLAGYDRYETSKVIAEYMLDNGYAQPGKAVIANGLQFPDALAVSSLAAYQKIPILLTDPKVLPSSIQQALTDLKPTQTIIVGGTAVVSSAIEKQLSNPVRYGGFDRYETAALIAQGMGANLNIMYLATGLQFPDALAGSVLAARTNSPIILADRNLTTPVKQYLFGNARQTKEVFVLGGTAVVPNAILDQVGGFVVGDSMY